MWCPSCQQDVPGVAASEATGAICCARCGGVLSSPEAATGAPVADEDTPVSTSQLDEGTESGPQTAEQLLSDCKLPIELDDWELQDDLASAQRLAESLRSAGHIGRKDKRADRILKVDGPHATAGGWHVPQADSPSPDTSKPPVKKRRKRRMSWLSWAILSLGLMTFVCGGVLLGWSVFARRGELWNLGLPLALGGLAALLIGLLFQLEGLWQSNHDTSSTLDRLDEQLDDLRHTTTLLGTTHSEPAKSFYLHMSEGASPQMLLADLKGQLDLLAQQMAKERRSA